MKLIKLSTDHYIVVDDSEIKEGDWVVGCTRTVVQCMYPENVHHRDVKKITHSTEPLGKPMLFTNAFESDLAITTMGLHDTVIENWGCKKLSLSEVKELTGEVDVEKKLSEVFKKHGHSFEIAIPEFKKDLISLYNQCFEDNKDRKYTEEDMRKALSQAFMASQEGYQITSDEIIQSLQPKIEWEVEIVDGKLKLKQ